MLFAAKAKKAGQDQAILDIGLKRATPGHVSLRPSKVQSMRVLRFPYGEEIVPSEDRLKG
jgi:large subunit ribosomal protein L18